MTTTVKVHDAKTRLSALLAEVEQGAEIVIARGDKPVAKLVPVDEPDEIEMGFLPPIPTDVFFEPMSEEELRLWEGA